MPNENDIKLIEISEAAFLWLTRLGNKVDKQFLKTEMFAHPDYPALTSLIDVLDAGNFDYTATRATFEDRKEFNFPCIINISLENGSKGLYYVENENTLDRIRQQWGGIILYSAPESKWLHPLNEAKLRISYKKNLAFILLSVAIIALSSISFFSGGNLLFPTWVLTAIAGLLICTLLLSQELGLSMELVQRVCGIGGNQSGCSAVLNSKYAQGKFGISIATIAFSYFLCQWILLLCIPYVPIASLPIMSVIRLSCVGILVAAWSIYTQKFIIKNWCPLCLGLVGILCVQSVLSLFIDAAISWKGILIFSIVFLVVTILIQPAKLLLGRLQELTYEAKELSKWKRDTYLFLNQWKEQTIVDCSTLKNEIELSNPDGLLQITVACNPYCPPCAKAHEALDQLIDIYGAQMSVKVRFGINPNDEQNEKTKAVNLILNAIEKHGKAREIIHKWFEKMDAQQFAAYYEIKDSRHRFEVLKEQSDWTISADIQFTPTIFLQGRTLPKRYSIYDINTMLPEIYDQIRNNRI